MHHPVITVENLSKKYSIHHLKGQYQDGLRHLLQDKLTAPFRRRSVRAKKSSPTDEEFWALRNVSLEISQGEVVGIIGRNGAGKSTLLKIFSRITDPTSGRVCIKGRVASLLEVGTGFHPELTGRENIFLNGAILGMTRAEIRGKFDEIVAFSEIEKFIDTPVKRFSSGMYVRLAFAVAAHLEPEILIVDEVLAVGDAGFQKKCIGRMQDVSTREGRTVLFVSHNMAAIRALCTRVVFLDQGTVRMSGTTEHAIKTYFEQFATPANSNGSRLASESAKVANICIRDSAGAPTTYTESNQTYTLHLEIENRRSSGLVFGLTIFDSEDNGIFSSTTSDSLAELSRGRNVLAIDLPTAWLNSGSYRIEGALWDRESLIEQNECYAQFQVVRTNRFDQLGCKTKGAARIASRWVNVDNNHCSPVPTIRE